MRKLVSIIAGIVFIGGLSVNVLAVNPNIGGDAVYTEEDGFAADDWGLTVYSYVYDNTSASLPGSFTLDPGQMLFTYLLDADNTKTVSIDTFSVGNPEVALIPNVGWTTDVVPGGYNVADHQKPYIFGYSGPAEAIIYNYTGDLMDPWSTLDPDEYSLLYYVAVSQGYTEVGATASGGGQSDNQFVPGPVPEPTTICLLGLGALALLRKRRA